VTRGLADALTGSDSSVRPRPRFDVTAYLTVWLVLLFAISAQQVVPGIGALGSPAMLLALTTPLLWLAGWMLPDAGMSRGRHPVRPMLLAYLFYLMFSFSVAMRRPLTELEASGALRSLLISCALIGIALLIADGAASRQRLDVLLRRLAVAAAFISLLGVVQFLTGVGVNIRIPGLTWNFLPGGVGSRSIFNRPSATALHPIEFSVITASLLPLAIHYALYDTTRRRRRNMATAAGLIALATPLAISRSGILSLLVGLSLLALGWRWRRRLNGALIALAAVPLLWAVIPGLVGTFVSLFGNADHDPSIQARLDRRPRIMALIRERPWFGLGHGTWSVEDYFLIDNEVYVTTLELGLVGLMVTAAVMLTAVFSCVIVAHLPDASERESHLALAIAACIAAFVISLTTFDAFHYRILTGSLFLLIGASGALWRFHQVTEKLASGRGVP
jgi:O-antigen ligase